MALGLARNIGATMLQPSLKQFNVAAIDLLGFGLSDKPQSRLASEPEGKHSTLYCIDLWAQQVVSFLELISFNMCSSSATPSVALLHCEQQKCWKPGLHPPKESF